MKYDSSFFSYTKVAEGSGPIVDSWSCSGDLFPGEEAVSPLPSAFSLYGVSPNPFNPTTTISYQLPANSLVSLNVYDVSGRLVATLVDGWRQAGAHEAVFDGSKLASGVYLVRLAAGRNVQVEKVVLLK